MYVRPAKSEEMTFLQAQLAKRAKDDYEQFPLDRAVVFVALDDDQLHAGMACLRLRTSPTRHVAMWQLEPLILFPAFLRNSPKHSQRKATYLLAKTAEDFIADPARNRSGVRSFFAYVPNKNRTMQGLARHIGWTAVKGKFFAKEI